MSSFVLVWCSFPFNLIHGFWIPWSTKLSNIGYCGELLYMRYQFQITQCHTRYFWPLTNHYLLFPFLHKTVEKQPEVFFPVLCCVQVPILLLFVIKTDACLVLDVTPHSPGLRSILRHWVSHSIVSWSISLSAQLTVSSLPSLAVLCSLIYLPAGSSAPGKRNHCHRIFTGATIVFQVVSGDSDTLWWGLVGSQTTCNSTWWFVSFWYLQLWWSCSEQLSALTGPGLASHH